MGKFASKKAVDKLEEASTESKESFDSQYAVMKTELEASVGKIDKFSKMMLNLQQEMKSRDEALKKVPPNCTQLLKDLNKKCDGNTERVDDMFESLQDKVDSAEFEEEMSKKLNADRFYLMFPKGRTPQDHLKAMISFETSKFNDEIRNTIKLWDQKISNIRSELNIHGLYRKMNKLVDKESFGGTMKKLEENSDQLSMRIAELTDQLIAMGNTNKEIEDKIDYVYERQREVAIGKRNINCLSCSEEPDNVTV